MYEVAVKHVGLWEWTWAEQVTSSKRRRTLEECKAKGSETRGSRFRKVDEGEQLVEMDTSCGSDYML